MKVVHDEKDTLEFTDGAAMDFLALTTHRLNEELKEGGVSKRKVRESICENFMFEFARHIDTGWLEHKSVRVFPIIAFAKRLPALADDNVGPIEVLHVPNSASSLHEYALGVVSQYFEESEENIEDIPAGSQGDEES